jgi:hypothetical protein
MLNSDIKEKFDRLLQLLALQRRAITSMENQIKTLSRGSAQTRAQIVMNFSDDIEAAVREIMKTLG